MPSPKEFNVAKVKLETAGWQYVASVMTDDAQKPGVTNFGTLWTKNGTKFYLNFKTLNNLPL